MIEGDVGFSGVFFFQDFISCHRPFNDGLRPATSSTRLPTYQLLYVLAKYA